MSLNNIKQLVENLNKKIEENRQVAVPALYRKASKYIEMYPEDKTLGALYVIFEKMASNKKISMRQADLRDLYAKHYTNNTKFASFFSEEMGIVQEAPTVKLASQNVGTVELPKQESVLSNALRSIFDPSHEFKLFSNKTAETAVNLIKSTLNNWDLKPAHLKVEAGNSNILIIKADYETPKGLTSFYIPVSTSQNKISEASSFVGLFGLQDFNINNIKGYIVKSAGAKNKITASDILNLFEEKKQISQAELALIRLKSAKKEEYFSDSNSIVGQKIAEASFKEVLLPKNKDVDLFSEKFASVNGEAEFLFKDNVKIAKDYVVREVLSLGYRNPQVKLLKVSKNTMYYGVSVPNLSFTVPVKVANDKIVRPELVLSNGKVASFNAQGISSLASDNSVAVKMSNAYGMNSAALITEIKKAVAEKNMARAEDCLNVLQSTASNREYNIGLKAFISASSTEPKQADMKKCSMIIKSSTSNKDICGHTGLPTDKVYQDKYGNCQKLYRQNIDELNDGVIFTNTKILG